MKKNNRGFTLIEGLILVAIIGLLAALLLPSLNEVRQNDIFHKTYGGLDQIAPSRLTPEEKGVIQPLVDKKLGGIAREYQAIVKARETLSETDTDSDPAKAQEKIIWLRRLDEQILRQLSFFEKIRDNAKYFNFEVKEKPQDYLPKPN